MGYCESLQLILENVRRVNVSLYGYCKLLQLISELVGEGAVFPVVYECLELLSQKRGMLL